MPATADTCTCGHSLHSLTITDEDLQALAELRELRPVMSFLRDFARMTGSVLSTNRKVLDALKK